QPVRVLDPENNQEYVVLRADVYERVAHHLGDSRKADILSRIPEGIRRSQEAFWRDLPQLLKLASNKRRWVAYHGDERVGFGRTETELYEECFRRGWRDDEFYVDLIQPYELPPWEEEGEISSPDFVDQNDP